MYCALRCTACEWEPVDSNSPHPLFLSTIRKPGVNGSLATSCHVGVAAVLRVLSSRTARCLHEDECRAGSATHMQLGRVLRER